MSILDALDGLYDSELDESKHLHNSDTLDEHIGYVPDAKVGDKVWDDLTGTESTVLEVLLRAYKLDNDYLGGVRFGWEVSKSKSEHK